MTFGCTGDPTPTKLAQKDNKKLKSCSPVPVALEAVWQVWRAAIPIPNVIWRRHKKNIMPCRTDSISVSLRKYTIPYEEKRNNCMD